MSIRILDTDKTPYHAPRCQAEAIADFLMMVPGKVRGRYEVQRVLTESFGLTDDDVNARFERLGYQPVVMVNEQGRAS